MPDPNTYNLFQAHWNWLHALSFFAQDIQTISNFDQLVTRSFNLLNCTDCIQDAQTNYQIITKKNLTPSQRILELHNSVNLKLKKKSWTLSQINEMYRPSTLAKLSKAYFDWVVPLYKELINAQLPIYQQLLVEFHQLVYQKYGPPPAIFDSQNTSRSIELKVYKYYQTVFRKLGYPITNYSQIIMARTVRSASGGCSSCQKKKQRLEAQRLLESQRLLDPQRPIEPQKLPENQTRKAIPPATNQMSSPTRAQMRVQTQSKAQQEQEQARSSIDRTFSKVPQQEQAKGSFDRTFSEVPQSQVQVQIPTSFDRTFSKVPQASFDRTFSKVPQQEQAKILEIQNMLLKLQPAKSKLKSVVTGNYRPYIEKSQNHFDNRDVQAEWIRTTRPPVPIEQRKILKTPELKSLRRLAMIQNNISQVKDSIHEKNLPKRRQRQIPTMFPKTATSRSPSSPGSSSPSSPTLQNQLYGSRLFLSQISI